MLRILKYHSKYWIRVKRCSILNVLDFVFCSTFKTNTSSLRRWIDPSSPLPSSPRESRYWAVLMAPRGVWWFMHVMSLYVDWCVSAARCLLSTHSPVGVNMMYGVGGSMDVGLCHVWQLCPITRSAVRGVRLCASPTCRCSSGGVSDGGGPPFRTCRVNVIDLSRGIDWNDLMSVNVSLKCLWN